MSIDAQVEAVFPIQCKGRDIDRKEVLDEPVDVKVKIYKRPGSNDLSSEVECPYIRGGHGDRCKASWAETGKHVSGIGCPYSFDVPYAFD
ncbi:MAG: hypothetical protein KKF46_05555 [Nanoarchaeota archaeon]|nr:hypothetical protein [Nanoarchaeota archaeon]MBU1321798.1 hypothetical protein [Nanoarchaeota archaeon]MBU1597326.1 hypothetical protein [Nanoarchaeota archaeon]MBU2441403.1 hypothetical protein [Nanoarchaeota archaeon]